MKHFLLLLSFVCIVVPSLTRNLSKQSNESLENALLSSKKISALSTKSSVKETIPSKIIRCMTNFNILRCMKIFILQRMEAKTEWPNTGNVTADFLNSILTEPNTENERQVDIDEQYTTLTDKDISQRLYASLKKFFHDREIKMTFIPGMVVKLHPSKNNFIDMSLNHEVIPVTTGRQKLKTKHSQYLLQMGVPAMFLPIVMLSSFMPMILPAIKMAALFAGTLNNAALIGALMYLARTAALENEKKNTVYFNAGGL